MDDPISFGTLPPPDGCPEAYCPALREGRIITGREGGPIMPSASQVALAVAAQDAAPALEVIPEVPAEDIPPQIRQSMAEAGIPVESMTNEARASIAIMSNA